VTNRLVEQYRRLDARAGDEESKAETYRKKANASRWEQCRIVFEAIEEGMSQRAFAEAVGRNPSHISIQCRMWGRWGVGSSQHSLPEYTASYAEVKGLPTGSDDTRRRALYGARNLSDDDLEDVITETIQQRPHVVVRAQNRVTSVQPPPFSSPPEVGNSKEVAILAEDRRAAERLSTAVWAFRERVLDANDSDNEGRREFLLQQGDHQYRLLGTAIEVLRGLGDLTVDRL
jgi:hypothetical protein